MHGKIIGLKLLKQLDWKPRGRTIEDVTEKFAIINFYIVSLYVSLCMSYLGLSLWCPFFVGSTTFMSVARTSKKLNNFNRWKCNFARASHFFVHFFAVTARIKRESLWRTQTSEDNFFFLFLKLGAVSKKSTQGKFAYIWHFQLTRINAIKFESWNANSFFKNDVLAAVADAKAA